MTVDKIVCLVATAVAFPDINCKNDKTRARPATTSQLPRDQTGQDKATSAIIG